MSNKIIASYALVSLFVLLFACASLVAGPNIGNFRMPVITLDKMEVEHVFGFWYYSKKVEPSKGNPDDVGAPLDLAFTFNIENPNDYSVMLENFQFKIAFEEFDLNTVIYKATQWIPAGKTNQVKIYAHFDVRQSLLSLLVTGGFKLQEKETNAWALLEKWWTEIPEYSVPVHVKGGSAVFQADGLTKVATFEATFPE